MIKYTHEIHNQILILNISGNLIGDTIEEELLEFLSSVINQNIGLCAIDISELEFLNSSGIGLLITILTKFRNSGGEVFLINPSPQVKKLLIITKLYAIFNIVDNKLDAIEQLNKI